MCDFVCAYQPLISVEDLNPKGAFKCVFIATKKMASVSSHSAQIQLSNHRVVRISS